MAEATKRKDGRWQRQIRTGTDENGRPKYKYLYAETKSELQQKTNTLIAQLEGGTYAEPSKITLGRWLVDWLEGRRPHIRENTWVFYNYLIHAHLIPTLGGVRLNKLTTREIQILLNDKLKNGRVSGGSLSPKTVKYIYVTLQGALRQAVKERLIVVNPAQAVELPKNNPEEMKTLNRKQVGQLLDAAKNGPLYTLLVLALSTGLRRGELLGLWWQDIDLTKAALAVRRQLTTNGSGVVFTEPKSKAGRRTIGLPTATVQVLKEHKKQQSETRLLMGSGYQNPELVFATGEGRPLSIHSLRHSFEALLDKAGVSRVRFHDLRHTYATMALGAGVSPKTLQEVLGHSQIGTTLDTYGHVTEEMQREAANKIGIILEGAF